VQYANGQKQKMLFGSDFPLIAPDRWLNDFKVAGFEPEVHNLILKENAIRALNLAPSAQPMS
jgi:predicted TIM-barrel fold metal-dependent hydrolase